MIGHVDVWNDTKRKILVSRFARISAVIKFQAKQEYTMSIHPYWKERKDFPIKLCG
jgi:hypothetical protein